jgi:hypothetical protein
MLWLQLWRPCGPELGRDDSSGRLALAHKTRIVNSTFEYGT